MILISLGVSFVMIRWQAEARLSFLETDRKKMTTDFKTVKESVAAATAGAAAAGGGASSQAVIDLTAKVTALEASLATATQVIASNTIAIKTVETVQAEILARPVPAPVVVQAPAPVTNPNSSPTTVTTPTQTVTPDTTAPSSGSGASAPVYGPLPKECAVSVADKQIYPISAKYSSLDILGQIYTAVDCGDTRVAEIRWLETSPKGGLQFSFGLNITLKDKPSTGLLEQLQSLGFVCDIKSMSSVCMSWSADKVLTLENLKLLKPFVNEIASDSSLR